MTKIQLFKVHLAIYSLGPFCLITIANVLLVNLIMKRKQIGRVQTVTVANNFTSSTYESKSKNSRMNRTVITMTLIFIAMTSPIAMASFFFSLLASTDYGVFIITLFDCVSFSYHGLNFVIMALSNKIFRNAFKKLFRCSNLF